MMGCCLSVGQPPLGRMFRILARPWNGPLRLLTEAMQSIHAWLCAAHSASELCVVVVVFERSTRRHGYWGAKLDAAMRP